MSQKILFNGKTFEVLFAEARSLTRSKRLLIPLPPSAATENPETIELDDSWDRRYLLIGERTAIEFAIVLRESLISINSECGEAKVERTLKNLKRWTDETAADNILEIEEIELAKCGRVSFTSGLWRASFIFERALTTDEFQVVQNAKLLAMMRRNAVGGDQGEGTVLDPGVLQKNNGVERQKVNDPVKLPPTPPTLALRPDIYYETRGDPNRWEPLGPHMMKRDKIRETLRFDKQSSHFRKIMSAGTQWYLNTQKGKRTAASYNIRDFIPDWKPPGSRSK